MNVNFLETAYPYVLWSMMLLAPVVFLVLFFISAPYGRHVRSGWGWTLPSRWGWLLMEAPASLLMLAVVFLLPYNGTVLLLLLIWQCHYFHRAFIYPFTLRSARRMPLVVMLLAVLFNAINAYLNGFHFVLNHQMYVDGWFSQPQVIVGLVLFFGGFIVTKRADRILRDLRKRSDDYQVPEGFLYRFVSCPNYLGESVQWLGWCLMVQSPAAWVFLLWTLANLVPRAISHHRWYQQYFADYPASRKAIVPYLI